VPAEFEALLSPDPLTDVGADAVAWAGGKAALADGFAVVEPA